MKLAFLFLTRQDIYQEPLWINFFEQTTSDKYNIYIHPNHDCSLQSPHFSKYEVKNKQPKGDQVLYAQRALLQQALEDADNQKFILLSDDSAPIQPFQKLQEVLNHDKSMIRYGDTWIPPDHPRFIREIPTGQLANAHWWVLNREHAVLMSQDNHWIEICKNYQVSPEHYPSNFLKQNNQLDNVIIKDILYERYLTPVGVKELSELDTESLKIIQNAKDLGYLFIRKFRAKILTPQEFKIGQ